MNTLTQEQIEKLREWLLSGVPFSKAVQMAEAEFEVQLSTQDISTFWDTECVPYLLSTRKKAASVAEEVANAATATPDRFDEATLALLKQRVFELVLAPRMDTTAIKSLVWFIFRAHEQSLRARSVAIQEEKWREARGAMQDTTLDEGQRQSRLKEIFGLQNV